MGHSERELVLSCFLTIACACDIYVHVEAYFPACPKRHVFLHEHKLLASHNTVLANLPEKACSNTRV
jgi:hypothetical protein